MATLAVFTVKRFSYVDGEYWTYGGFGDYVKSLLPHFDRVLLACHPKAAAKPPKGWYRLGAPNLEFYWLPYYEGEAQCLVRLPEMFAKARKAVVSADIVNARVPDYSGICGALWARWYRKPLFVSHVDNWHGKRGRTSRLRGLGRLALDLHYMLYCMFERIVCRNQLTFVQGDESWRIYGSSPLARKCVSASHAKSDVIQKVEIRPIQDRYHIVSVGRLVHVKAHHHLIEALHILDREQTRTKYALTIAGEGDRLANLKALTAELGLVNRVRFVGQLDRSEIFELYDSADLFCLPSLREGTPKVLLEAMARGVPVIATDVGGVRSVVVDGKTGILTQPGDPRALAAAIRRLAEAPGLSAAIATEALVVARQHTVEQEWGRMIDIVRTNYPYLFTSA